MVARPSAIDSSCMHTSPFSLLLVISLLLLLLLLLLLVVVVLEVVVMGVVSLGRYCPYGSFIVITD